MRTSLPERFVQEVGQKSEAGLSCTEKRQHVYLEKGAEILTHLTERGGGGRRETCSRPYLNGSSHLDLHVMFIIGSEDKLEVGL